MICPHILSLTDAYQHTTWYLPSSNIFAMCLAIGYSYCYFDPSHSLKFPDLLQIFLSQRAQGDPFSL